MQDDLESEMDAESGPWTDWFPPSNGIALFEGLLDAVRSGTNGTKRLPERAKVEEELGRLIACLQLAAERAVQFRLERSRRAAHALNAARAVMELARDRRIQEEGSIGRAEPDGMLSTGDS